MTGVLGGLPGIIEADASYPEKEARVVYNPALIDGDKIVRELVRAGYPAARKEEPPAEVPFQVLTGAGAV